MLIKLVFLSSNVTIVLQFLQLRHKMSNNRCFYITINVILSNVTSKKLLNIIYPFKKVCIRYSKDNSFYLYICSAYLNKERLHIIIQNLLLLHRFDSVQEMVKYFFV